MMKRELFYLELVQSMVDYGVAYYKCTQHYRDNFQPPQPTAKTADAAGEYIDFEIVQPDNDGNN